MELNILYQDDHIVVCQKPVGIVSEETEQGDGLADLLKAQCGGYVATVHRLDRAVGGVMVYAKSKLAAAKLSAAVQDHSLKKEYLAVVHGSPDAPSGRMIDLLFHDRTKNKTFVVDRARRGVKEAILDFELQRTWNTPEHGTLSLIKIQLLTGRTHQIRVQFSSRQMPLLGDGKYGARDRCDVMLFCRQLSFPHPKTGKPLTISAEPKWNF